MYKKWKKMVMKGWKSSLVVFWFLKSHGFLGASPNGLVTDESCENPLGLVEMKNIKLKENETLKMALLRNWIKWHH